MLDKPKRKQNTNTLFKLKLTLIAFITCTLIVTFFPMIWLAPPLFAFTPFVYIGLSLLWIPIVWRVLRQVTGDRVVKGLMIACLVSSILISSGFHLVFTTESSCRKDDTDSLICSHIIFDDGWCRFSFNAVQIGNFLVARHSPMLGPGVCNGEF